MLSRLNNNGKALVGAVLVALLLLFSFLNNVPWASKETVAEMKADLSKRLDAIETDVRAIREHLMGDRERVMRDRR